MGISGGIELNKGNSWMTERRETEPPHCAYCMDEFSDWKEALPENHECDCYTPTQESSS